MDETTRAIEALVRAIEAARPGDPITLEARVLRLDELLDTLADIDHPWWDGVPVAAMEGMAASAHQLSEAAWIRAGHKEVANLARVAPASPSRDVSLKERILDVLRKISEAVKQKS